MQNSNIIRQNEIHLRREAIGNAANSTLIEQQLLADYKKLYRLAYSYVHNENDALDIVQESAYKAMKHCHTLRNPQYAGTWLYRIVVNESISFLRRHRPQDVTLQELDGELEDTYADMDLQQALAQLPPLDKTIVTLRYFEGLPLSDIAEIVDENINTVKSRLYRALKKLKVFLTEEGAESYDPTERI